MGDLELKLFKFTGNQRHAQIDWTAQPKPEVPHGTIEPFTQPDFKADDLFSEDAVLNWSSPDATEPMPLTGDESGKV